ncbi:MAG: fumarylacetoacetate hydrolase family protein [Myxococcales bacterium]|nr:fumarylacetoacetate hydrolase family protein [Myxococcales bacterium]MCB9533237.1 fumarylacetoacetate hydrolase family protein [Myxococcales bacterium]
MTTPTPHTTLEACAAALWTAQTTLTPCPPLTRDTPTLTVADAYAIQTLNVRRRERERGLTGRLATKIGLKIGLTSRAVQKWLGVDEPDFGVLLDDMVIPEGSTAPTGALLQPRAEGEIAFVLGRPLRGPGITAADVVRATEFVLPAIEVVDSRVADWAVKYVDTVADNASSGMFVLGTTPTPLAKVDLALVGMSLSKNGRVESTGVGAACLGNPVNAVAWLANKFGEFGRTLEPGDVILSGALGPVVPVSTGDHVEVQISGLGGTHARF